MTNEERLVAEDVVKSLIDLEGVDCLALGEVNGDDLESLISACDSTNYGILDGSGRKGRLSFDTGLLYNSDRFILNDFKPIVASHGRLTLKVAHRVDFNIINSDEPLHVFISHWPSRAWCAQNDYRRDILGLNLRRETMKIEKPEGSSPQIVLLGDFNDEPFDESLSKLLLATRDRVLARRHGTFFYNPFWRLLGESQPHGFDYTKLSHAGTYFYKSGHETRWNTFDQIIVSSAFLQNDGWYLNEELVKIWQHHPLDHLVYDPKNNFDHFPVLCVFQDNQKQEKVNKNG